MSNDAPGPGQLRVRVRAAGLNRADLLEAERGAGLGRGRELAGELVEVGPAVNGWGTWRSGHEPRARFAPEAVVPARHAMHVSDSFSFEEAGALPIALMTMHDALTTNGLLATGDRVLVHAATSGVGVTGVQLSALLGAATVFATSRSAAKLGVLRSFLGELTCELIEVDMSAAASKPSQPTST